MPQELTTADVFELLAKRRRRLVLGLLHTYTTPLTMGELTEHIGSREYESLSPEQFQKIYLDLFHNHLPTLEAADAVESTTDEGTVYPGANFDRFVDGLEKFDERELAPIEERARETDTPHRRIELFVRSATPTLAGERVDAVRERLGQLREQGFISGFRVRQWPPRSSERIDPGRPATSCRTRQEIVAEFHAWASEHDYSLRPAFGRRLETTTGVVDDPTEYCSVPLLTLALYEDETLAGVIPCTDAQRTYTVADFLAACDLSNLAVLTA